MINFIINQLLPLGKTGGFEFRYYTKESLFTKAFLINELKKIPEAFYYLPDDINLKNIKRNLLFTVRNIYNFQILEHVSPERYVNIYDAYKKNLATKEYNNWSNYKIEIKENFAEKISQFIPSAE